MPQDSKYTKVYISHYGSLSAALSAIGSTVVELIIDQTVIVDTNASIPATIYLNILPGGIFVVLSNVTLTINGPIEAGLYQIFSGSGTVSFSGNTKIIEVYPQWWGATGDGVTDDTLAIVAALESANGLTKGTWSTSYDDYLAGVPTRKRFPVRFCSGNYRITSTISVRFYGVVLCGSNIYKSLDNLTTLTIDHSGNAFDIDATYLSWDFAIKNLKLIKAEAYQLSGDCIAIDGPEYYWGPIIEESQIEYFNRAIYIKPGGLTDGTGSLARLVIEKNTIAHNYWAIYITGHAALSRIKKNNLHQNIVGGVYIGGKTLIIEDNDLEGQARPLEIVAGTASTELTIRNNYFEQNETGTSCILLGSADRFDIKNNMYGNLTVLPEAHIASSKNGTIDTSSVLYGCADVQSKEMGLGSLVPLAASGVAALYNFRTTSLSEFSYQPSNYSVLTPIGDTYTEINSKTYNFKSYDGYRYGPYDAGPSWPSGDWLSLTWVLKYTLSAPHGTPVIQVFDFVTAESFSITCEHTITCGDTAILFAALRNPQPTTVLAPRAYIWPYGSDTTVGSGVKISQAIAEVFSASADFIPFPNPLELLPEISVVDLITTSGSYDNECLIWDTVSGKWVAEGGDIRLGSLPSGSTAINNYGVYTSSTNNTFGLWSTKSSTSNSVSIDIVGDINTATINEDHKLLRVGWLDDSNVHHETFNIKDGGFEFTEGSVELLSTELNSPDVTAVTLGTENVFTLPSTLSGLHGERATLLAVRNGITSSGEPVCAVDVTGNLSYNYSPFGQGAAFKSITAEETIDAATSTICPNMIIPSGTLVYAVSSRVNQSIPGVSTFDIGVSESTTRYGNNLLATQGSTFKGLQGPTIYSGVAPVVITPKTTPTSNSGRVRITIHYVDIDTPNS